MTLEEGINSIGGQISIALAVFAVLTKVAKCAVQDLTIQDVKEIDQKLNRTKDKVVILDKKVEAMDELAKKLDGLEKTLNQVTIQVAEIKKEIQIRIEQCGLKG